MYESTNATVIVERIIGSDSLPVSNTVVRLRPNPSNITAYCRIFFEVYVIPGKKTDLFFIIGDSNIPISMAKTGPPTTGNFCPIIHDGVAITRARAIPATYFFMFFVNIFSFNYF